MLSLVCMYLTKTQSCTHPTSTQYHQPTAASRAPPDSGDLSICQQTESSLDALQTRGRAGEAGASLGEFRALSLTDHLPLSSEALATFFVYIVFFKSFYFFIWLYCLARGILVPQVGLKHMPFAVETQS